MNDTHAEQAKNDVYLALGEPPLSESCVPDLLEIHDRRHLAEGLILALKSMTPEDLDDDATEFFQTCFSLTGIKKQTLDLVGFFEDDDAFGELRYLAAFVLFSQNQSRLLQPVIARSSTAMGMFFEQSLRRTLRRILAHPILADSVLETMWSYVPDRTDLQNFKRLNELRKEEGVPACLVFRDTQSREFSPEVSAFCRDQIVEEGSVVGRSILENARARHMNPSERRAIDNSLKNWQEKPQPIGSYGLDMAYVCCAEDCRNIFLFFESTNDAGQKDLLWIEIDPVLGILTGGVQTKVAKRRMREFFSDRMKPCDEWIDTVEFPPSAAAHLVLEARKTTLNLGADHAHTAEAVVARVESFARKPLCIGEFSNDELEDASLKQFFCTYPYTYWAPEFEIGDPPSALSRQLRVMALIHQYRGERYQAALAEKLANEPERVLSEFECHSSALRSAADPSSLDAADA